MEEDRWGQKGYLLTKPGAVEKKNPLLLCTGPFVLNNQRVL